MKPQTGFTLLEVLVALAVLAIAMGAIISAATQSINTVATLRDQTFASWVALNQVNVLLLEPKPWPEEGSRSGKAELANRAWRWEARFSKTEDADLRRLDLTVRASEKGPELIRLMAFKGKKPEPPAADQNAPAGKTPAAKNNPSAPKTPKNFPMNSVARGFTLLELLVALAVFSIMSVAAYSGLHNVLFTRAAVEQQSQRLAAVQLAVYRLEQDIEQAIPRSIRDEYGEKQAALLSGELNDDRLTLTRAGWDNPLGQPRANAQRIAWRLRDGRLWRLHWPVLDRGGRIEPRETLLLDRVQAFKVRFLDQDEWRADWPPHADIEAKADQKDADPMPRAVEISLTLEDWGEITRLLPLSG